MIALNREKCVGCGDCVEVCPQECFVMGDGNKSMHAFPDRCMECGACRLNCSGEAISVEAGPGCFVYIIKQQLLGKTPEPDSATG
ncbi:MAG: ferredoxin family protein [Candidatus Hydrogenedentota bacterium]|nr:MAG: ferredoxin family protein [Candidatus Hydrogenedentota bacterium]